MLTLPSTFETATDASQAAFAELYDFYLKEAITTPWGSASVIRIASAGGNITFFTPTTYPEPAATRGDAATYREWPVKRKLLQSKSKFANDKLAIAVSNVTAEWAQMLADVDWYDVPVIIRKTTLPTTGLANTDCVTVFEGQVDSARITLEQIQFTISSNLGSFQAILPAENMHAACRFRWADDLCTALRHHPDNSQPKTAKASSTTTKVLTDYAGYADEAVVCEADDDTVTLASHTLLNGHRVRFAGTTLPTGITRGQWYYVVAKDTNTFKVATAAGGTAVNFTTDGTSVTITSEKGLLEDSGAEAAYGTDLVNALADGAITASSEQTDYEGYEVKSGNGAGWRFSDNPSNPTPAIDIFQPYITLDFGSPQAINMWRLSDTSAARLMTIQVSSDGSSYSALTSLPLQYRTLNGLPGWWGLHNNVSYRYWKLYLSKSGSAAFVADEDVIGKLYAYTAGSTTDLVNSLADGVIGASDEATSYEAHEVKSGNANSWRINAPAASEFGVHDWGYSLDGYWQIPDAQAGLANAALKPYLQFDLGSAKRARLWRFKTLDNVDRSDMPRLILIFSSPDASTWTFERYFEIPPRAGETFDCPVHAAASAQHWRICVRTTWAEQVSYKMFNLVYAYENNKDYWAHGRITFAADTPTAALQGISRRVTKSWSGGLNCETLPAAPAAGDRFVLERGCPQTFNGCAERLNTENYGGFDTLPSETVVR
jgi:phage-related protein